MPEQITLDDVLALPGSVRNTADVVQTLVDWSEQVADWSEPELHSPAQLLILAADHSDMGGLPGATELLDRAESAPGHDQLDVFEARISHLLNQGASEEAFALEERHRRIPPRQYQTYEKMADLLDYHDATDRGLRWANIGLRRMEDYLDAEWEYDQLLVARYFIRRRQGMKPDGYDREAEEIAEALTAERVAAFSPSSDG